MVWTSDDQFIATSANGVHRGWVGQRLGGKGEAYCEAFASDLADLPELLAWFERHRAPMATTDAA